MFVPYNTKALPLGLPMHNCKVTASYLNEEYRKRFGFPHYGVDMVPLIEDPEADYPADAWDVLAQAPGVALASGTDETLGGYVVVEYKMGLACIGRYFHLAKACVKKGDIVVTGQKIGVAGNTGKYTTGRHLHVELDKDLKYPFWTPTLAASTKAFVGSRGGATARTMIDPLLYSGVFVERHQQLILDGSKYSK